jgi:hypothetical protein
MSSRGKLSSSTTSLNRSKQNTNNRTKTTKEKKNVQTVHEQEINQLESYVRNRNKELDEEINSIRNKLKSSSLSAVVNDKSGSSRFKTSAEDGNLKKMSFTSDGLAIGGKGIGKVNLDPSSLLNRTRTQTSELDSRSKKLDKMKEREKHSSHRREELTEEERDHLITFLAKLKLSEYSNSAFFTSFSFHFPQKQKIVE